MQEFLWNWYNCPCLPENSTYCMQGLLKKCKKLWIGRSENKLLTQFLPFEDEVRPGVAYTSRELSFTEVIVLIPISEVIKFGRDFQEWGMHLLQNGKSYDSHHNPRFNLVFECWMSYHNFIFRTPYCFVTAACFFILLSEQELLSKK